MKKLGILLLFSGLQWSCISGDEIKYVEGTIDEYLRLHWEPFVKENDRKIDERRFKRKKLEPVACTRDVLNNLPRSVS